MKKKKLLKISAALSGTLLISSILLSGCEGGGTDTYDSSSSVYADTDKFNVNLKEDTFVSVDMGTGLSVIIIEDGDEDGNGGIPGTGGEGGVIVTTLEYRVIQFPKHGEVMIQENTVYYKPTLNWSGTDFVVLTRGKIEDLEYKQIEITFHVSGVNHAPTIEFGIFGTKLLTNTAYTYTPVTKDVDGDDLSFYIVNKPVWMEFDKTTGTLTGTTYNYEDTYTDIVISVTDGTETTSLDPFTLTVASNNHPPSITGTPLTKAGMNSEYYFKPIAKDTDGDTLTFTIQNKPDWASFSTTSGELSGTCPNFEKEYSSIVISASDGIDTVDLPAFSILVENKNHAPTINGNPTTQATFNQAYNFIPIARDPDGDTLTFSIQNKPVWAAFNKLTGEMLGTTPNFEETYSNIVISVTDNIETVSLDAFTIEVVDDNHAPEITGTPTTQIFTEEEYRFAPIAKDVDNDTLTFTIQNKPSWIIFDSSTGIMTGTSPKSEDTYSNIIVSVSDGKETTELDAFSIVVSDGNHAPTINGIPTTQIMSDEGYNFTPVGNDVDGDTLTYTIQNKPNWIQFSTSTGSMTGTAPNLDREYTNITITVSDGEKYDTLTPFSINVEKANHVPTIEGVPTTQIGSNENYEFVPISNDDDNDALTFSIQNKPNWITFSEANGEMSGVAPNFDGVYSNISITVSDGQEIATLPSFSIEVKDGNHAPTIEGVPTTQISGNETYSFTPISNDVDGDVLEFYIASKPAWATFDATTGTLDGTTPNVDAIYEDIVIYVNDGKATAYLSKFNIIVNETP